MRRPSPRPAGRAPSQVHAPSRLHVPAQVHVPVRVHVPLRANVPAQVHLPSRLHLPARANVPAQVHLPSQVHLPARGDQTKVLYDFSVRFLHRAERGLGNPQVETIVFMRCLPSVGKWDLKIVHSSAGVAFEGAFGHNGS